MLQRQVILATAQKWLLPPAKNTTTLGANTTRPLLVETLTEVMTMLGYVNLFSSNQTFGTSRKTINPKRSAPNRLTEKHGGPEK